MRAQSVYRNLSFGTTKPRDLEYVFPVPQLAGLLTRSSTKTVCLPKSPQWQHRQLLPAYSDEIAQASHLFPYSPQNAAPTVSYLVFRTHYVCKYNTVFSIGQVLKEIL